MAKEQDKGEFKHAVHTHEDKAPAQGELGHSEITYGEQRYEDGVTDAGSDVDYVEPGREGAEAVRRIMAIGGVSSHERFDNPMKATPTGDEPFRAR